MVIYANGSWAVLSQTITRKGEEIDVPCKHVRYCPPVEDKNGKTFFPSLGPHSFFQVLVQHVRGGGPLKVKMGLKGFRVTFPDSKVKANWWDTEPTVIVKGETTEWMDARRAMDYFTARFGQPVAEHVMGLLIDALNESKSG